MLSPLKHDLTMAEAARGPGGSRVDLLVVADMVEHGARVLDVVAATASYAAFGNARRRRPRHRVVAQGVNECVAEGLAVVQGDADTDLNNYPDDAFDFVILSQTLQATRQPRIVLWTCAHRPLRNRLVSEFRALEDTAAGRARRPHAAYRQSALCMVETPNIHFCSIRDFRPLCHVAGARLIRR